VSRTEHDGALAGLAQAAHILEHVLIHYNLFINRDEGLLHDQREVAAASMIVSAHYSFDHLCRLLLDLFVDLVLIR